jgi:hypothetical protein
MYNWYISARRRKASPEKGGSRAERKFYAIAKKNSDKGENILFLICRRHKIYSFGRIVYFFSVRSLEFFFSFFSFSFFALAKGFHVRKAFLFSFIRLPSQREMLCEELVNCGIQTNVGRGAEA